jgi:hypothetical protein
MRPDPPIPSDGSCAQCGQPRQPERSKRYGKGAAELDPFCSGPCCRGYHDTTLPPGMTGGGDQHAGGASIKHGTRQGYELCACDRCKAAVA